MHQFHAEQQEVVEFALRIENEKLEVEEIASWLKEYTKKTHINFASSTTLPSRSRIIPYL